MTDVVLASNNPGKLKEFESLLPRLHLVNQSTLSVESIEESGLSFLENALLKARHAADKTGLAALADDSGLAVSALKGAPGIYSSRYAGAGATDAENNRKLLAQMQGLEDRRACFCCALVYLRHSLDPVPLIGMGFWHGELLEQPRGEEGFGYDPLFFLPQLGKTASELSPAQKNRHSHRCIASEQLMQQLSEW